MRKCSSIWIVLAWVIGIGGCISGAILAATLKNFWLFPEIVAGAFVSVIGCISVSLLLDAVADIRDRVMKQQAAPHNVAASAAAVVAEPTAAPQADSDALAHIVCPKCGERQRANRNRCQKCGGDLHTVQEQTPAQ